MRINNRWLCAVLILVSMLPVSVYAAAAQGNTEDTAEMLTVETAAEHTFTWKADTWYYKVTIPAAGYYDIDVVGIEDATDWKVSLYNAAGTNLVDLPYNKDKKSFHVSRKNTTATYTLKITYWGTDAVNLTTKVGVHSHSLKTTSIQASSVSVSKGVVTASDGSYVQKCSNCDYSKTTTTYAVKTITPSAESYAYSGKVQRPTFTVKDRKGNVLGTAAYSVSYSSGCKTVGKYTATVTFKDKYSGKGSYTFTIVPKKTTLKTPTSTTGKIALSWEKQATQTTGYQIQYATSSKFASAKSVTITSNTTVKKTLTGLTSGKKYYVRIRTYKTVDGKKYYSDWSAAKSINVK